jgi:RNA polymerase sigma-70 factor (ECF subfamily)
VYAVALAHLGRAADAEDAAQGALLLGLERIDQCREPERFGPWLLQITRNHARHLLARRKLRDVPAEPPPDEPAGPEDSQAPSRRELVAALAALPETQREVLLLHDLHGWTHPEVSASLGLSEEACRQHLSRARRALRAALDPPDRAPE